LKIREGGLFFMAHCDNVICICVDPRLNEHITKWIKEKGFGNNYAPLRIPGGVKDLVRPENQEIRHYWWDLKIEGICLKKLGATNFYFFGHNDCADYPQFSSYEEEHQVHAQDLVNVHNRLFSLNPLLNIWLHFAHIIDPQDPQSPVEFEEIH
jgi:hypothetical protein